MVDLTNTSNGMATNVPAYFEPIHGLRASDNVAACRSSAFASNFTVLNRNHMLIPKPKNIPDPIERDFFVPISAGIQETVSGRQQDGYL